MSISTESDGQYEYITRRFFDAGEEMEPPENSMRCIECGVSIDTGDRCRNCGEIPVEFGPCGACRCVCGE